MRQFQKTGYFRFILAFIFTLAAFELCAEETQKDKAPVSRNSFYPVDQNNIKLERSCSVYVPAYSHIYLTRSQITSLGITLSIRNVDSGRKIYISRVEYFDTYGVLTDVLVDGLHALEPMATVSYVIDQHDMRGGVGANFIVHWAGEKQIHPPIFEAVMVGSVGTKGYSFSSRGETVSCDE